MNSVEYYLSPKAIRETTAKVFDNVKNGQGLFRYDESQLDSVSDFVVSVIKDNYPTLEIPYHSRWGHFKVGQNPRLETFLSGLEFSDPLEKARVQFDLVIPSVLLDAGAGKDWKYQEADSGEVFNRSEGLGVASFYMFTEGAFSSQGLQQSDQEGLAKVTPQLVAQYFQVSESNPLVGLEGRAQLVNSLSQALNNKEIFKSNRLGSMVDYLVEKHGKQIPAESILEAVIKGFGSIWPGRIVLDEINLGDAWKYSLLSNEVVVFHKLSQWLTYSLFEPLESIGCVITNANNLTGLAEYRNGGLLVDKGLIALKDPSLYDVAHEPSSDLIIEWRALTVQILDLIANKVRQKLSLSESDFPLAKILEGGTWHAGRRAAKEKRPTGEPPIRIKSDGTVF